MGRRLDEKMVLVCKSCGKPFDSTFTVREMEQISTDQYEQAGTLHLCPHCGTLSTYLIRDYQEKSQVRQ